MLGQGIMVFPLVPTKHRIYIFSSKLGCFFQKIECFCLKEIPRICTFCWSNLLNKIDFQRAVKMRSNKLTAIVKHKRTAFFTLILLILRYNVNNNYDPVRKIFASQNPGCHRSTNYWLFSRYPAKLDFFLFSKNVGFSKSFCQNCPFFNFVQNSGFSNKKIFFLSKFYIFLICFLNFS